MTKASDYLTRVGLPGRDAYDLPTSTKRFADGGHFRIEIPSTEGPRAMEAVLQAAAVHQVTVHRISQGSGIMLQTDDEIRAMVALGRQHGVEVCLFVGPRANWDIGIQTSRLLTTGMIIPARKYTGWEDRTRYYLRPHTDREIVTRRKALRDLPEQLTKAWCVVTHASMVAVDAVIAGVPVYLTGPSIALPMGQCTCTTCRRR